MDNGTAQKIVLIACSKTKSEQKVKAKDMYKGGLFIKSLRYAQNILKPEKIFILSAKYGLLDMDKEIEPYDETLNGKTRIKQREWALKVFDQINSKCDSKNDMFLFLAGKSYYQYLKDFLPNTKILMEGLSQGKRLQWLKEKLNE